MMGEADQTAAPEALPQRVEQADHVALVQAQARKAAAEQALALAAAQLELAHLRHQLAQRELGEAEAGRATCAERLRTRYQLTDADQVTPDGVIWRAQPAEGQG